MKTRPACINCGLPSEHDHHVVPRSLGGVATVPLCGACHGKAHGHRGMHSISSLTRRALAAKRARGESTGEPPYGFATDSHGRLMVNDDEAATISRALELQRAGVSVRKIAAALTAEGRVSRNGQPHSATAVFRMLRLKEREAHRMYQPLRVVTADHGPLFADGSTDAGERGSR